MRRPTKCVLLIAVLAVPTQAGEKLYVNTSSVVHKATGETAIDFPDVCKTPLSPDAGSVPLPYPNTARSSDLGKGTKRTKAGGRIRVATRIVRTRERSAEVYAFKLLDRAGRRVAIRESVLIELEDGTFCGVCVDKGRITALLRLYRTPPLQVVPRLPELDLKPSDPDTPQGYATGSASIG